jgi:hypothetical protein
MSTITRFAPSPMGKLHIGVDGFLLLWSHLPRYRWLGRIVGARGIKLLAVAPLLFVWGCRRETQSFGQCDTL